MSCVCSRFETCAWAGASPLQADVGSSPIQAAALCFRRWISVETPSQTRGLGFCPNVWHSQIALCPDGLCPGRWCAANVMVVSRVGEIFRSTGHIGAVPGAMIKLQDARGMPRQAIIPDVVRVAEQSLAGRGFC